MVLQSETVFMHLRWVSLLAATSGPRRACPPNALGRTDVSSAIPPPSPPATAGHVRGTRSGRLSTTLHAPQSARHCSSTLLARTQVFVVHGDVLALSSDAYLVPTRNLNNRKWFPAGPPEGAKQPHREAFTPEQRVLRVEGAVAVSGRSVWLGHVDGRFAPVDRRIDRHGDPELEWFLEAASQFLHEALADLRARDASPRCGRARHVLAMPVVGTGKGGARGSSGEMIAGLLQLLEKFVADQGVDVALVVKNDRMFSAAQAHRRLLSSGWEQKLGDRLMRASSYLATLAVSERLCLFLGAGVSVGAGLPEWRQLLETLASRSEVSSARHGGAGGTVGGHWAVFAVPCGRSARRPSLARVAERPCVREHPCRRCPPATTSRAD